VEAVVLEGQVSGLDGAGGAFADAAEVLAGDVPDPGGGEFGEGGLEIPEGDLAVAGVDGPGEGR
jgi:hypothetical protein